MPIDLPADTPEQARSALLAAADGERRTLDALTYGRAAPFFIVWGVVWAVGFTSTGLGLERAGVVWGVAVAAGWAGTAILTWARAGRGAPRSPTASRYVLSAAALSAYAVLWAFLLLGHQPNALGVYAGSVTGCGYALAGLWRGPALSVLGVAITVLFLAGMPMPPSAFAVYAGVLGGGGLVTAGVLLGQRYSI